MNGYVPEDPLTIAVVFSVLAAAVVAGFIVTWLRSVTFSRLAAWLLVFGTVAGVERLTALEPAGVRMLAISLALLWTLKALVAVEEQVAGRPRLVGLRYFMFTIGWPGMRPSAFAAVPGQPRRGWAGMIRQGARNLFAGALLVVCAWFTSAYVSRHIQSPGWLLLTTIFLLPGLCLVVHFGLFQVLAGLWRFLGADCHVLFRAPLRSTSLSEFWGQRWNVAFSEMTALIVFRPLKGIVGRQWAMAAAFLFSGCLHELAISVPVRAGYGLPLLYFALHAAAMQIENALSKRGRPVDSIRWVGRLWTLAWLALPLPILFHRPFLRGCVWPLIGLTDEG